MVIANPIPVSSVDATSVDSTVETKASYRPEIDGLRALAVVAVIINHFNKEILPSGYLGVDIFFVISGFVITSSLANRPSQRFSDFILGFYTRRIKRLVPALGLFVVVMGLLIRLFNPDPEFSLKTGFYALFGLSNLYLLKESTDYFATSTELNVFTHTWSLGVEEQFYFLFPVLAWLTGFSRQVKKGSRRLWLTVALLSAASLIAFVYLYQSHQPAAYFLMPARLWEIGAGCLLFLGLKRRNRLVDVLEKMPAWLVATALISVFFAPIRFGSIATLAVVLLTVILLACLHPGSAAYRLFTHRQVVYVGLISYSLYLWHWGVLAISRWTIGIHAWSIPLQCGLMMLCAIASYRYVETPLRHAQWSKFRWRSIGYGIVTAVIVAGFLMALLSSSRLYLGRAPSLEAVTINSLTDKYSVEPTFSSQWGGSKCVLDENEDVGKEILIENCTLGDFEQAEKRVLVIGDSFAPAFTQAFDELVLSDGYAVTITSSFGASPVKEVPNETTSDKINDDYWNRVVPSLVGRLQTGDKVLLISDLVEFSPKRRTSKDEKRLQQLGEGLRNLSNALAKKNLSLAVLHGNPFAVEASCEPVIAAKQWFSPFGGPCKLPSKRQSLLRRERLNDLLTTLEREKKLVILDLFDTYCPGSQCTFNAASGEMLYRDEYAHPSIESARLSAPTIREVLKQF